MSRKKDASLILEVVREQDLGQNVLPRPVSWPVGLPGALCWLGMEGHLCGHGTQPGDQQLGAVQGLFNERGKEGRREGRKVEGSRNEGSWSTAAAAKSLQ